MFLFMPSKTQDKIVFSYHLKYQRQTLTPSKSCALQAEQLPKPPPLDTLATALVCIFFIDSEP